MPSFQLKLETGSKNMCILVFVSKQWCLLSFHLGFGRSSRGSPARAQLPGIQVQSPGRGPAGSRPSLLQCPEPNDDIKRRSRL